ncbi:hypothetical protein LDENG_00255730 [Lucifuga dentata]|nr:hypothetical protein LDENG_00255730 [Lucifuga dentata]
MTQLQEGRTEKTSPPPVKPARQKQRAQQQAAEESSVAEEPESISPELARCIRLSAKDLKIRQTDRRWASEVVNDFRDNLLRFLKNNEDQP